MTKRREGKAGRAALDEIDVRLGELFGEFGSALVDMVQRLDTGSDGELRREHVFETEKGPVRAQTGIRLRVGGLESGHRRGHQEPDNHMAAGHAAASSTPSDAADGPATRPIAAEIFEDNGIWRLTADLPGVARKHLDLCVEDSILVLVAEARGRRYADRIPLPAGTTLADLAVSLKNGVLEIEAPSRKAVAP